MHATQILARPLTGRVMTGIAYRRTPTMMKQKRSLLTIKDHVVSSPRARSMYGILKHDWTQYFSKATAEGPGRNGGIVKSAGDAPLELKMSMPKNTGGKGDGQNPEQLFAMGYSCELS